MARIKLTVVGLYNYNNDLFSLMQLPTGIDRDNLIMEILERAGDLGLLYPDYDFMHTMIGVWSANEQHVWEKMFATQTVQYNPIENYDRTDDIRRNVNSNSQGTNTDSQTAFNSDTFKDTNRSQSVGSSGGMEIVSTRSHGNVGVTSSQQMIEQEREVSQFSIYGFIARSFIDRFCIELY